MISTQISVEKDLLVGNALTLSLSSVVSSRTNTIILPSFDDRYWEKNRAHFDGKCRLHKSMAPHLHCALEDARYVTLFLSSKLIQNMGLQFFAFFFSFLEIIVMIFDLFI